MKRREEMGLPAWLQIHVIELPVDVRNRETGEPSAYSTPRKIAS